MPGAGKRLIRGGETGDFGAAAGGCQHGVESFQILGFAAVCSGRHEMVTAVRLFDCRLLKIVRGADPCILWVGVPWVWRMAEAVARKFDGRCGQGRQLRISSTAMFDTRRQAWRYGREDVGAITPEFAEHDLWLQRRDVNVTAV